eukprot:1154633-Pelagomonas_calceolata.AAC.2
MRFRRVTSCSLRLILVMRVKRRRIMVLRKFDCLLSLFSQDSLTPHAMQPSSCFNKNITNGNSIHIVHVNFKFLTRRKQDSQNAKSRAVDGRFLKDQEYRGVPNCYVIQITETRPE